MYFLVHSLILAHAAPAALSDATKLLGIIFPNSDYGERLVVGRAAQLGPEMIYRPGVTNGIEAALTYGEFDFGFFAELVQRALDEQGSSAGQTFVDVGSGCGRLVFGAAALWPDLACVAGVERVDELHRLAVAATAFDLPLIPRRQFICGDAADSLAAGGTLANADVLFVYSSAFPSHGDLLTDFSEMCGEHLRVGTRIVTTDKRLADGELWSFKLIEAIDGPNRETFGSVGYVQEVTRSIRGRH